MSEHERFTAFLRNAAARYHEPPATPREEMWREIAGGLEAETETPRTWLAGDDELLGAAASYHAPPATPHDDMWGRVEAAWELRRSAPPAAREAGLETLSDRPLGEAGADRRADRRRALSRAGAVLALAASLLIGIAIGRGSIEVFGGEDGAPRTAAAEGSGAAGGPVPSEGPLASADDSGETSRGRSLELAPDPGTAGLIETLETARPVTSGLAVADGDRAGDAGVGGPAASGREAGGARPTRSTRDIAIGYATAKHLGQAETLLTSFRADSDAEEESRGSLEGTKALSEWARVLLADTRLLLDLPVERSATERALLQDLELVLAQVARLGPGAPAFERELIAESIEREGTIARLRAAAPPGASATLTGT